MKFQGKDIVVIDQVSSMVLVTDSQDGDGITKYIPEDKSQKFIFFGKMPKGSVIDDGSELRMMVVE
jgi:hypothetical protein